MAVEIVSLKKIQVRYGDNLVLHDVDFSVLENDFIGVIGPNGGGKTTLLKVILGLLHPTSGEVNVFGEIPEKGRRYVGYVPQSSNFDLEFPVNVFEVVMMGRLGKNGFFKRYSAKDREITDNALKKLEIFDLKHRQVGMLSGGEQQRVFIARALATEPRLLILDEPTVNVDKPTEAEVYETLNELKKSMAIILVSHDVSAVSVHVEKIACLNRRLHMHDRGELSAEILEETYKCPIDLIAHGIPHRVLAEHGRDD
jgi:zinc transport system ATP-binding protein